MKKDKRSEEKKNGDIIDMLDSALDEDISEISEMSELEESSNEAAKPGNKSAFHFIVGLIFIILAAIGLISTVGFVSDKVRNIIDNTEQKNEFAKFIYPVVICDPPGFDATTKLKNETIISAAVWDIILYEDKSKYELDFDYLIVPEVDIEQHAAKLFGSGLTINHMTIASADISFYYDGEISSYRIPENPKFFTYSPYIESISKIGESYTLTVGYVSPTPAWLTLTSDEAPSPEKYVDYVVQKRGTSYTLVAIKQSEMQAENAHDSGL
ncbi:MAG: hypothetical protein ACI4J0_04665 [Huintestinicola sp.]|uniref:hypothetical protein n=1 Tax=Huintestinicola sp. TaxID=2981661 RepID=UPI003F066580